jgi:hypothetical protein
MVPLAAMTTTTIPTLLLEESKGIRCKRRNSCPAGNSAKKSCESGKKQEFPRPPPKPRSCEKILRKTQEKKEILRNPFFNCFWAPTINSCQTGIGNLVHKEFHLVRGVNILGFQSHHYFSGYEIG